MTILNLTPLLRSLDRIRNFIPKKFAGAARVGIGLRNAGYGLIALTLENFSPPVQLFLSHSVAGQTFRAVDCCGDIYTHWIWSPKIGTVGLMA